MVEAAAAAGFGGGGGGLPANPEYDRTGGTEMLFAWTIRGKTGRFLLKRVKPEGKRVKPEGR